MTFKQIENTGQARGSQEISDLLEQARKDVPEAEAAWKQAEGAMAKAETERTRLERLRGQAQQQAKLLFERQRAAKRRALESHANETADDAAHAQYVAAKKERQNWLDRLSFLTSWSLETATRACLVTQLEERRRYAEFLEATAVSKRLGLMRLAATALAEDPGAQISLQDEDDERGRKSLSTRLAIEVKHILDTDVPRLELEIRDHDRRVAAEQTLVGEQLWA